MLIETGYGLSSCKKSAVSGGGPSYLDSVVSSVCCDLDATIVDSYDGSSQTWANLIASPNDGAAQTDYDLWLGSTSLVQGNDPVFTGTAGDPAAYFEKKRPCRPFHVQKLP